MEREEGREMRRLSDHRSERRGKWEALMQSLLDYYYY